MDQRDSLLTSSMKLEACQGEREREREREGEGEGEGEREGERGTGREGGERRRECCIID